MIALGLMDCHVRPTVTESVRSRSAWASPPTSQSGAHRGAVLRRYRPINPAAPVMIARGAMAGGLLARQLPIPDPMRLVGFFSQALLPVRFVLAVVPFEPHDLAVAFEGQHVSYDAVEEPPVVAADHGPA